VREEAEIHGPGLRLDAAIESVLSDPGVVNMMKRIALALVLALLCACVIRLPAFAAQQDEASKKELEKFQGTWVFVSMEQDGREAPKTEEPHTVTFEGDKFTVKLGNKVVQAGTHKLDPTKKPKTVDATVTEGEGKGTTMLGIYELEGDTIKVCFDSQGKQRPSQYRTAASPGYFMAVVKRSAKK
jgi:uncharacterized protein (TIGR03067 family)